MADEQEDFIEVSAEECQRWSNDINEKLDEIRAKQGEEAYRLQFMTAFLLMWFAQSIGDDNMQSTVTISKPGAKDMN